MPVTTDKSAPAPLSQLPELQSLGGRENLADVAYGALRDVITDGTLAPGVRLREIDLSQRLGVSTTPIREALRRLEREGLVEISPRRGALVRPLDRRAIADLYELRELLESHALRRGAERDDLDLTRAIELFAAGERTLGDADQLRFNRLDVELHHALTAAGGNEELAELATRVHRRIQVIRVRFSVQLQGRLARSHAEHAEIISALRRKDGDDADRLIRGHVRGVRDAVLSVLTQAESPSQTR